MGWKVIKQNYTPTDLKRYAYAVLVKYMEKSTIEIDQIAKNDKFTQNEIQYMTNWLNKKIGVIKRSFFQKTFEKYPVKLDDMP